MPIPTTCEFCEKTFQVRDDFAGRNVKCPNCKEVMRVPKVSPSRANIVLPPAPPPGTEKLPAAPPPAGTPGALTPPAGIPIPPTPRGTPGRPRPFGEAPPEQLPPPLPPPPTPPPLLAPPPLPTPEELGPPRTPRRREPEEMVYPPLPRDRDRPGGGEATPRRGAGMTTLLLVGGGMELAATLLFGLGRISLSFDSERWLSWIQSGGPSAIALMVALLLVASALLASLGRLAVAGRSPAPILLRLAAILGLLAAVFLAIYAAGLITLISKQGGVKTPGLMAVTRVLGMGLTMVATLLAAIAWIVLGQRSRHPYLGAIGIVWTVLQGLLLLAFVITELIALGDTNRVTADIVMCGLNLLTGGGLVLMILWIPVTGFALFPLIVGWNALRSRTVWAQREYED